MKIILRFLFLALVCVTTRHNSYAGFPIKRNVLSVDSGVASERVMRADLRRTTDHRISHLSLHRLNKYLVSGEKPHIQKIWWRGLVSFTCAFLGYWLGVFWGPLAFILFGLAGVILGILLICFG